MTYYTRFNTQICEIILVGDAQGLSQIAHGLAIKERLIKFEQAGSAI